MPFVPLNFRLSDEQLLGLVTPYAGAVVVADDRSAARLAAQRAPVDVPAVADVLAAPAGSNGSDVVERALDLLPSASP